MIKVTKIKIEKITPEHRYVRVELLSDTAVEVEDIGESGESVTGLLPTDLMTMGSTCFTSEMEFGMLDSTGNWKF